LFHFLNNSITLKNTGKIIQESKIAASKQGNILVYFSCLKTAKKLIINEIIKNITIIFSLFKSFLKNYLSLQECEYCCTFGLFQSISLQTTPSW